MLRSISSVACGQHFDLRVYGNIDPKSVFKIIKPSRSPFFDIRLQKKKKNNYSYNIYVIFMSQT